jgi:hypothetical protein
MPSAARSAAQPRRVASANGMASKSTLWASISSSVMAAMRSVSDSCSRLALWLT